MLRHFTTPEQQNGFVLRNLAMELYRERVGAGSEVMLIAGGVSNGSVMLLSLCVSIMTNEILKEGFEGR